MKTFKKTMAKILLCVLLSTMILPMLPPIEASATSIGLAPSMILPPAGVVDWVLPTNVTEVTDVTDMDSLSVDKELYAYSNVFFKDNLLTGTTYDNDDISGLATFVDGLNLSSSSALANDIKDIVVSYTEENGFYHLGNMYLGVDEDKTDSKIYVHVTYDISTANYVYIIITAIDSVKSSIKDSLSLVMFYSDELVNIAYSNREYNNNLKALNINNVITKNKGNRIAGLVSSVLSSTNMPADLSNPDSLSENALNRYRALTGIASYGLSPMKNAGGGGTLETPTLTFEPSGTIIVDEKSSDDYFKVWSTTAKYIKSTGGIGAGIEVKNSSSNDANQCTMDYDSNKVFINLNNEDWTVWGDASALVKDVAEGSLGGKAIGMAVAEFIQKTCSTDLASDQFTANVEKLIAKVGPDETLSKLLSKYIDNLKKLQQGYVMEQQQEWLESNTDKTLLTDASSAYEAISMVLGESIKSASTGNTIVGSYLEYNSEKYYVGQTANSQGVADTKSIYELWKTLTPFQRSMLSSVYANVVDVRDLSGVVLSDIVTNGIEGTYSSTHADELLTDERLSIDYIKNAVANRDSNMKDNYSVYNIAINSSTLGKYIVGTMLYGEGTGSTGNIYDIYDATLAGLMKKDYNVQGINQEWFPQNMPMNIPLFGDTTDKYTILLGNVDDFDIFASFLYNVSYAFDVAAFSEGAQGNYDPEALLAYFTDTTAKSSSVDGKVTEFSSIFTWLSNTTSLGQISAADATFNNDEVSINMLRSIVELNDLCEFLGMGTLARNGGWTDAIATYLAIYDAFPEFFSNLRSNPNVYASAPVAENSIDEPLGMFFKLEDKKMSDSWVKGFSISSLYVPMETNVYDSTSIAYVNDPSFVTDFYYKYAFYRKALYINTDNSAIVNAKVSNSVSGTRIATLRDLLNYERDIVLTIDDNFYNAKDINDAISTLDYTAVRNGSSTDTETGLLNTLGDWVGEIMDLNPEQVLKTGANPYYSTTLANNVTKLGDTPDFTSSIADAYVLSEKQLIGKPDASGKSPNVFDSYEYSVKQSYGVVSAVYRSVELYNECLRALATDNAIFKSSKGICSVAGTNASDWRSIYNYAMLANLEEQMKNDAASTLDLDAPIFCDVFGNIVTESGLVIIPAATNATLCGANWNPNSVGFSEYYNNGNRIKLDELTDEVYSWLIGMPYEGETRNNPNSQNNQYGIEPKKENGGGYMVIDATETLILRTTSISSSSASAIIQWDSLNKNSTVIKELLYSDAYFTKAKSGEIYSLPIVNMVMETMRGAPIEYIDYEYEGISGNTDISKFGVYSAYKLEELSEALVSGTNGSAAGGNSMVTMPNLAFIDGIEVYVFYAYRIVFALMSVMLVVSLYLDAVKNKLGVQSVIKFVTTCLLTIVAVTLIPNLMNWSYYNANKNILSEEVSYIMMLNYVKDFDGSEIGITKVTTPETTTELYLKLDDVSINWWDALGEVLFSSTTSTVTELYENQLQDNAMALQKNVVLKADGLYMNVQDVFDSTSIVYKPAENRLRNIVYSSDSSTDTNTVVSYTLPYYVILDKLIANIDEYNTSRDVTAYSWQVGANGHIMTYDIISPYLTSSEFMDEGFDILGLNEVLQTKVNLTSYTGGLFTSQQIDKMSRSLWYPTDIMTDDYKIEKINELYMYARDYVANNANVLGKIPDEVFLKVFAMQLAIKYNQEFNVPNGNAVEIMNIDTRDLARLMVADRPSVYKYYSYSFPRFVFETSGTLGVIFSAIFLAVLWLTSMLKPILIILFIVLLCINVVFRKVLLKKESKCIEGYLTGCAVLCLINYAYSFMLKMCLIVAESGLGSIVSISMAVLIQIAYTFGLVYLCVLVVKDWQNNGFSNFQIAGSSIMGHLMTAQTIMADKFVSKYNEAYNDSRNTRRYESQDYDTSSVDEMLERDAEREDRGTYAPI